MWLQRFTPIYMYVKILESGIQDLKKEKRFGLVLEILDALISQEVCRQHKRAEWYAEKALVLHKCSRSEEVSFVSSIVAMAGIVSYYYFLTKILLFSKPL